MSIESVDNKMLRVKDTIRTIVYGCNSRTFFICVSIHVYKLLCKNLGCATKLYCAKIVTAVLSGL